MNQKTAIKAFALALSVDDKISPVHADMLLFSAATFLVGQPGRATSLNKYAVSEYRKAKEYLNND